MGWLIAIILIFVCGYLALKYIKAKNDREIVTCGSCGNRMTRKRFNQGGCPRCGSDIYTRTGHLAEK